MFLFIGGTRNDHCRDSSHRRTNSTDEIQRSWIGHCSSLHRSLKFVSNEDLQDYLSLRLFPSCCACVIAFHCTRLPWVAFRRDIELFQLCICSRDQQCCLDDINHHSSVGLFRRSFLSSLRVVLQSSPRWFLSLDCETLAEIRLCFIGSGSFRFVWLSSRFCWS